MAAGCREVRGEAGGNNPESMAVVSDPARWLRAIKIAGLWKSLTENYAEEYINSQESLLSLSLSLYFSLLPRSRPSKGSGIDFREYIAWHIASVPARPLISLLGARQTARRAETLRVSLARDKDLIEIIHSSRLMILRVANRRGRSPRGQEKGRMRRGAANLFPNLLPATV